jgi:hypothetical protein
MSGDLSVVSKSYKDYSELLDRLSIATKVQIYQAIYNNDPENASDAILSLGCAISVDPAFQKWQELRM